MNKKILILGRSTFLKKLDLKKINYDEYDVLCINTIQKGVKPKYVVSVDENYEFPKLKNKKIEWISRQTGWEFVDFIEDRYWLEEKKLSWGNFSSSVAVSFAILRGYKEIYLAGVELIGNQIFLHNDGTMTENFINDTACIFEKFFIRRICEKHKIKLYTLNKFNPWIKVKRIKEIEK